MLIHFMLKLPKLKLDLPHLKPPDFARHANKTSTRNFTEKSVLLYLNINNIILKWIFKYWNMNKKH